MPWTLNDYPASFKNLDNAKQLSNVFDNKDEAVKRAREIAENKGTKLKIYKQNGAVQEEQSY